MNANVLIDEEGEAAAEHAVVVDSADATEEEVAVDSAAVQTETAVLETTILRTGSPGNVYVNHDGT